MVQEHDPYEEMFEGTKDSYRPALPGDESRKKEAKVKKKAENESAKSELADAESGAAGGLYKNGASIKKQEEEAGRLNYTGKGRDSKKKGPLGGRFKISKLSLGAIIVMVVAVGGGAIATLGSPMFAIGHLDFNLQDSLGFTKTAGILQKQASYVVQEDLAKGEVPMALASDFARHGIDVGQVTVSGDFVRTNVYIADVDKLKDLATLGHYEVAPSDGELAVLYDGEVIVANDFVKTIQSNLKLFADYTEALDITAKYYYSDEVEQVYKDMGLSRSVFHEWVDTGDQEKNKEQFEKLLEKALDNKSDLVTSAYNAGATEETARARFKNRLISPAPSEASPDDLYQDPTTGEIYDSKTGQKVRPGANDQTDVTADDEATPDSTPDSDGGTANQGSWQDVDLSNGDEASTIIQDVANSVTGANANEKAAQLLNAAISAGEPYLAASAFIGIESPIQQARIEGTGPVNELMNALYTEKNVTYTDINTGKSVTEKRSILTTDNFVAAVSGGKFSKAKAMSFARDRALVATNMNDYGVIRLTSVASNGQDRSSLLMPVGIGDSANADELMVLDDSVDKALVADNYELWPSLVGGNRAVEGGAFLSNTINSHVIGAVPSDEATIAAYNREANVEVARMAAAERATKSPFDISSPHTFMGNIVHGLANAMIRSGGAGGIVPQTIGTVATLTDDSTKGVLNTVIADGENDADYGVTFGDYCDTVQSAADARADIYCTAHTTMSTGYMQNNEEDWKNALGDNLDESGSINEDSDLATFIDIATDRWATVGVKSAEACEKWKEKNASVWTKIGDFFTSPFALNDSCGGVGEDDDILEQVATGAYYTNSSSNEGNRDNVKLYSAYVLYDKVSSLVNGSVSRVSELKDKIYAKRPQDNSRAGKIARISGMTKHEAEVALAYADYLTFIARYNPAERYAFGVDLLPPDSREPIVEYASQVAVDLYVMWHGRTEYDDLRTRTRVA